ncbi:hypothetical protein MRX96_028749 [Rhipicephalus microplus]
MVGLLVRAGPKPIVEPIEAVFCPSISDKLTACGRRRQMRFGDQWAANSRVRPVQTTHSVPAAAASLPRNRRR